MHFLTLLFVFLSIIIHEADHSHKKKFKLILKVAPVLFLTAVFGFFSSVSVNLTFTLLYLTIYINYKAFVVALGYCKTAYFDFSWMY